jgi:hypothetical protein
MRRAGFVCLRDVRVRSKLRALIGRQLPPALETLLVGAESTRRLFSVGFSEMFLKPDSAQ